MTNFHRKKNFILQKISSARSQYNLPLFLWISADRLLDIWNSNDPGEGGGGVLPSKRLLGMCRWTGSHFHNWIDYNGVTFLVELLEWVRTFSRFLE